MGGLKKKAKSNSPAKVAEAFKSASREWLTKSRATMLASISSCLGVYKAERHAQQHTCVGMIGEALKEREEFLQEKVDHCKGVVDGSEGEKASREKAVADANRAKEELDNTVDGKQTALEQATHTEAER